MPNFSGNWKIIRSENFEELLKALGKEVFEGWGGGKKSAGVLGAEGAEGHKEKEAESGGRCLGVCIPEEGRARFPGSWGIRPGTLKSYFLRLGAHQCQLQQ